jgi:hypothetical protein
MPAVAARQGGLDGVVLGLTLSRPWHGYNHFDMPDQPQSPSCSEVTLRAYTSDDVSKSVTVDPVHDSML